MLVGGVVEWEWETGGGAGMTEGNEQFLAEGGSEMEADKDVYGNVDSTKRT